MLKDKLMLPREEDYKQNAKKEKEKLVRPGASRVVEVILTKIGDNVASARRPHVPPDLMQRRDRFASKFTAADARNSKLATHEHSVFLIFLLSDLY